jgi:hypothetical protein
MAYAPALFNEYAYDSRALRDRAALYTGPEWRLLVDRLAFWDGTGYLTWRPLTALGLRWVDWGLFNGLPALSHLIGISFHALTAWLAARLVSTIAGGGRLAGWAGLIAGLGLAVHPLASEVVYCGAFRSDSMAMSALLGSVLLALGGRPILCGFVLLLGMLAKETAVAGVVLVPLSVWLVSPRSGKNAGRELAGPIWHHLLSCSVALVLFALGWLWFRYPQPSPAYLGGAGPFLGMVNFCVILGDIALPRLLFGGLPGVPLRIDHDYQPVTELAAPRLAVPLVAMAGAVLIILGLWLAVIRHRRHRALAIVGLLLALLGLLPVAQIVPIPDPVAERLWYPALVGLAIWSGAVVAGWLATRPRSRGLATLLLGLILVSWTVSTHRRGFDWSDDLTLNIANWQSFSQTPMRGHEALAHLLQDRARLRLAEGDTSRAREDWLAAMAHARIFVGTYPESPVSQNLARTLLRSEAAPE